MSDTRALIDRVRDALPRERVREVSMFGVIAFMVDDAMAVGVHEDGSLLVRVARSEDAELVESVGASRPEMGAGRSMGVGWIRVDGGALERDDALHDWIEAANRGLARRRSVG